MQQELTWIAGTCPPPDGIRQILRRQSDGMSGCPTVIDVAGTPDVIVQGYDLDPKTRKRLGLRGRWALLQALIRGVRPLDENAVRLPKSVYLQGAEGLTED